MSQFSNLSKPARAATFFNLYVLVAGIIYALIVSLPAATGRGVYTGYPTIFRHDYAQLQNDVHKLQDDQARSDNTVVTASEISSRLSDISLEAATGHYVSAENKLKLMQSSVGDWRNQLALQAASQGNTSALALNSSPSASFNTPSGVFIPILIYHYTPSDFEAQVRYLETNKYTVVGLDAVSAALTRHASLPKKPVVLTFDDGFENQMQAYKILKAHHMKATFYIINGGVASRWCIGAGRRYNDPLQPANGCGDDYLTWDQVRELDGSGLITIGGHTIDHLALSTLSVADQKREIENSKIGIEKEIGHKIYDFAYPYGSYDSDTVSLVEGAGYRTAVTTVPGVYQSLDHIYTLSRIRTTLSLP